MLNIFLIFWFGLGIFSGLMCFIQWILEGCLVHEGEDRYYYLNGMLINVAMTIITGPVALITQITYRMPILPAKHQKKINWKFK
jgi:hypothetical protein